MSQQDELRVHADGEECADYQCSRGHYSIPNPEARASLPGPADSKDDDGASSGTADQGVITQRHAAVADLIRLAAQLVRGVMSDPYEWEWPRRASNRIFQHALREAEKANEAARLAGIELKRIADQLHKCNRSGG